MIFFIEHFRFEGEEIPKKGSLLLLLLSLSLFFNRCPLERKTDSRGVVSHPLISKSLGNNYVSFSTDSIRGRKKEGREGSIRNHFN